MKKGLLVLAISLMSLAPTAASAAIWYRPYWVPYWGPYGYYGYSYGGHIKLDTKVKTAEVFIDGGFVGNTHQAKSLYLRPGRYNIEIREGGATKFVQEVYVVPGKTLHLKPTL